MNDNITVILVKKTDLAEFITGFIGDADKASEQLEANSISQSPATITYVFHENMEPWGIIKAIPSRHELGSFKMYPDPVEIKPVDKD